MKTIVLLCAALYLNTAIAGDMTVDCVSAANQPWKYPCAPLKGVTDGHANCIFWKIEDIEIDKTEKWTVCHQTDLGMFGLKVTGKKITNYFALFEIEPWPDTQKELKDKKIVKDFNYSFYEPNGFAALLSTLNAKDEKASGADEKLSTRWTACKTKKNPDQYFFAELPHQADFKKDLSKFFKALTGYSERLDKDLLKEIIERTPISNYEFTLDDLLAYLKSVQVKHRVSPESFFISEESGSNLYVKRVVKFFTQRCDNPQALIAEHILYLHKIITKKSCKKPFYQYEEGEKISVNVDVLIPIVIELCKSITNKRLEEFGTIRDIFAELLEGMPVNNQEEHTNNYRLIIPAVVDAVYYGSERPHTRENTLRVLRTYVFNNNGRESGDFLQQMPRTHEEFTFQLVNKLRTDTIKNKELEKENEELKRKLCAYETLYFSENQRKNCENSDESKKQKLDLH